MPDEATPKADTSEVDGKKTDPATGGADTQTAKTEDAPKFTQADLDRIAAKTRSEEQRKAREAKEKEDKERQDKQDEAEKKFEKLASDRKARIDEIEPQLEQYKAKVAELAASELAALPDEVRETAPAVFAEDKSLTNPLEVLAWLPKGKKLAEKLTGTVKRGNGGDPPPAGSLSVLEQVRKDEQKRQESQQPSGGSLKDRFFGKTARAS